MVWDFIAWINWCTNQNNLAVSTTYFDPPPPNLKYKQIYWSNESSELISQSMHYLKLFTMCSCRKMAK